MNFEELSETSKTNKITISKTGKILITITGSIAIGLTILCGPFISPALRKFCLPYLPATEEQIANILKALRSSKSTKLIDLGSGDGRIVLEAAKQNLIAHGVELNPWLVLYSKFASLRTGQSTKTKFFCKDLWKFDLSKYDSVIIFGVEQMMCDLEKKISRECPDNCRIIACRFPLPHLAPIETFGHGVDTVWLYKISNQQ